jgi:hypothetical protein
MEVAGNLPQRGVGEVELRWRARESGYRVPFGKRRPDAEGAGTVRGADDEDFRRCSYE